MWRTRQRISFPELVCAQRQEGGMSESDEFVVDAVYQEEDLGEWQYTEEDKKHT